jgi:uncharacterized protein YajQ (UPF0234 family)
MPSFDIVSQTDLNEVDNAVNGMMREIGTRYDFKGSQCSIERNGAVLTVVADDDLKLRQMHDLLSTYLTRRKIDPGVCDLGKPEKAGGNTIRQLVTVKQGIAQDLAKGIVKELKNSKLKVQVAIQGDSLRVTGKKRDDLQEAIALVKGMKIDQPLQYENFRD